MNAQARLLPVLLLGLGCLGAAVMAGLALGSVQVPPAELWGAVTGGPGADPLHVTVVQGLRFPRVLMAALSGAVLAVSGLCFQCILRNPLAEPYILGISGGAAVGSILGILLGWAALGSTLGAFAGSMVVLFLVLHVRWGRRAGENLLLSGVMINAFCGAIILFLIALARNSELSSIMFWFMGNLAACDLATALVYAAVLLPGCLLVCFSGHLMNLLLLGEDAAHSLGIPVQKAVLVLLVLVSVMVSALVAAVGPLGFVGLVVPQALRLALGPDHRILAPASALFGASFLVVCDLAARTLPPQGELPSGVITALIGAPLFIFFQWKATCPPSAA